MPSLTAVYRPNDVTVGVVVVVIVVRAAAAAYSVYATTTPELRKSREDRAPGVGGLYMSDCAPSPFNPAVT